MTADEGLVVPHADREAAYARAQAKRAAAFDEASTHRGNCAGCGLAFRSRFAPPMPGATTHYADGKCHPCALPDDRITRRALERRTAARAEQEPAPEPELPGQTTLFDLGGDAA